jgi:hypothetical protein
MAPNGPPEDEMIERGLFAVALLAMVAAPATAKDDQADRPDSERVVCKNQRATGSRLAGERICKTKAEWDREKQEARNKMDEAIEDRSSTTNTGG